MMRIGFIGLGTMGRPMAMNLVKRGYVLHVCDRVPSAVDTLVRSGAQAAGTPRDAAVASNVIITMLPNSPDVDEVVLGTDGVIYGARPGTLVIDMSTIDPATTRKVGAALVARGIRMLDAPVGRTSTHAEQGKLLIMVGGEEKDLKEAQPIFEALGDTIVYCGPLGAGETMKLVNNFLSTAAAVITAEGLALGVKAGLRLETILDVVRGTTATNGHLSGTFPARAFKGNFEPGFMIDLAHKDLGLALNLGTTLNVPLPVGAACREVYTQARAAGLGRLDWSGIVRILEAQTGVELRLKGS